MDRENPDLIIAQRTYTANGHISLEAHRLCFRDRINVDRPYIFPKLEDEIPDVGCPDLHCTFRGIRDWDTVVQGAKLAGNDCNVSVVICIEDVESEKRILIDFERSEVVDADMKNPLGLLISCADFKPLYNNFGASTKHIRDPDPSTPSMKMRTGEPKPHKTKSSMTIGLKIFGVRPDNDHSALRADLNINLIIKH